MTLDGNKVRQFLKIEQKSREWLATQLDCSLNTVRNILAGRIPQGETLVRLAKLMGCQVETLVPSEAKKAG